jgi:hypothetical protein
MPRTPEPPQRPEDEELLVRSEPIDTDDGGQVVIAQQNVGPGNEVGGGEFPSVHEPRSAEEAAREQSRLDAEYEEAQQSGD